MNSRESQTPFGNTKMTNFLAASFAALPPSRTMARIASEIGLLSAGTVRLFVEGKARLPIDKVPALAKAIGADPALLFSLAVDQYWPDQSEFLRQVLGLGVSANEFALISELRKLTNHNDPAFNSEFAQRLALMFQTHA